MSWSCVRDGAGVLAERSRVRFVARSLGFRGNYQASRGFASLAKQKTNQKNERIRLKNPYEIIITRSRDQKRDFQIGI